MYNNPVKDSTKFNTVIAIGTTIHNLADANVKDVFLLWCSYHLPTTDVQLLLPQNYHQLYGAYSIMI